MKAGADYILGHSEPEIARLQRQAEVHRAFTGEVLRRAGLADGQSVLDVGCGAGDVSLAAADLVGSAGSVRGIDRSSSALDAARARADAAGLRTLAFDCADIEDDDDRRYDAVIGRFVLLHQPDPTGTLRTLVRRLKPGGVVAFIEMDLSTAAAEPPLPVFSAAMGWITEVYRLSGFHRDMGSRLYAAFRGAGLTPDLVGSVRIEGGPDAYAYDYVADTVRSLMPWIESLGIASADEVGLETLSERIRRAAAEADSCFFYPRMVGAFAGVRDGTVN